MDVFVVYRPRTATTLHRTLPLARERWSRGVGFDKPGLHPHPMQLICVLANVVRAANVATVSATAISHEPCFLRCSAQPVWAVTTTAGVSGVHATPSTRRGVTHPL